MNTKKLAAFTLTVLLLAGGAWLSNGLLRGQDRRIHCGLGWNHPGRPEAEAGRCRTSADRATRKSSCRLQRYCVGGCFELGRSGHGGKEFVSAGSAAAALGLKGAHRHNAVQRGVQPQTIRNGPWMTDLVRPSWARPTWRSDIAPYKKAGWCCSAGYTSWASPDPQSSQVFGKPYFGTLTRLARRKWVETSPPTSCSFLASRAWRIEDLLCLRSRQQGQLGYRNLVHGL